jgi:hypothetical protein
VKTPTLAKPKLSKQAASAEAAMAFAEAGNQKMSVSTQAAPRAFYAPEGYRRLTINLPLDLHKKLKLAAVHQDCTATEIIERLLKKELGNQV